MPEFVRCPGCGFRVQTIESLLGKPLRCLACGHSFVPTVSSSPDPLERHPQPALPETESVSARVPRASDSLPHNPTGVSRSSSRSGSEAGALCFACYRPISWKVTSCPHCGTEFEPEEEDQEEPEFPFRRDCEPHRGGLLLLLGNTSLILGALSLCLCGLGGLGSIPLGGMVCWLATRDLNRMEKGLVDPRGRRVTRDARTAAIVGIVLSLFFGFFCALFFLAS
jgi:hypothetical protein